MRIHGSASPAAAAVVSRLCDQQHPLPALLPPTFNRSESRSAPPTFPTSTQLPTLRDSRASGPLYEEEYLELPAVRASFVTAYLLLIGASALGNLFLIGYVWKSAGHALVLSVAACDFVRSAVLTPLKLLEFLNPQEGGPTGDGYCRAGTFFVVLLGFAEFHSVAAVSQERLLLVRYPFAARRWLSRRNVRLAMAGIWLTAGSFALVFSLVMAKTTEARLASGPTYRLCTVYFFEGGPDGMSRVYTTFVFVLYYLAPVAIVAVSYVATFRTLAAAESLPTSQEPQRRPEPLSGGRNLDSLFRTATTATATTTTATTTTTTTTTTTATTTTTTTTATTTADGRRPPFGAGPCERELAVGRARRTLRERQRLAKTMLAVTVCFAVFNSPVFVAHLCLGWGLKPSKNAVLFLLVVKFLPTVCSLFNPFVYCTRRRALRRPPIAVYRPGCGPAPTGGGGGGGGGGGEKREGRETVRLEG